MTSRVIALVPAFNEEAMIEATVDGLIGAIEGVDVVVVDDGSRDRTATKAIAAGATVLTIPKNLGKGGAVNEAFRRLNPADEDILLFIDADLGATSNEASKLIVPLIEGRADMVVAAFGKPKKKGGFGLVKGLARWGIKHLGGIEVRSPLSGQRALRAGLFRAVGGLAPGYGMETALTIDALRAGNTVLEVDTEMGHNETGRDIAGFAHRGRQLISVLMVVAERALRPNRASNKATRK